VARTWLQSHLHEFELPDGRRVGFADVDPDEHGALDHAALKVGREVSPGDRFSYVFDLEDNWRHTCRVLDEKVDPRSEYGELPERPVALWGWGWIPDQYGRETFDADE
jgi:hypothetical protein